MTENSPSPKPEQDMPLMAHFAELRTRLIRMIGCVVLVFLLLVGFSRRLYDFISNPLVALLPPSSSIIATDITSGFLAPIALTFFVALFLSVPYILSQIWAFVAPALYKHEKKIAIPLLLSSIVLFYIGVAFAYFVVLVPALTFFVSFLPENVLPMTDVQSYLGFVIKLFFVFGVMFEIPVATLILVLLGVVSTQSLIDKRKFIIVGCFAISAIVTPPDGASMVMLAVPMCLLFEFGLLMAKLLIKNKNEIDQQANHQSSP